MASLYHCQWCQTGVKLAIVATIKSPLSKGGMSIYWVCKDCLKQGRKHVVANRKEIVNARGKRCSS